MKKNKPYGAAAALLAGALLVHHGTGHGESRKPRPHDAGRSSSPDAESTDAAPGAGRP